jgi:hypothetical protein
MDSVFFDDKFEESVKKRRLGVTGKGVIVLFSVMKLRIRDVATDSRCFCSGD